MTEPENLETEQRIESDETVENIEEQTLLDATHDPGGRIEQTQEFAQAEVVEIALVDAISGILGQESEETPTENTDRTPDDNDESQSSIIGQIVKGAEGKGQPMDQEKPPLSDAFAGIFGNSSGESKPSDKDQGASLSGAFNGAGINFSNDQDNSDSDNNLSSDNRVSAPTAPETEDANRVAAHPAPSQTSSPSLTISDSGYENVLEVPEGIEISVAESEDGGRSGEGGDEVAPIPVPMPKPGIEDDGWGARGTATLTEEPQPGDDLPGSNLVSEEPEPGPHPYPRPVESMQPDPGPWDNQIARDHEGTGGNVVEAPTLIPDVDIDTSLENQPDSEIEESPTDSEESTGEADEGVNTPNYYLHEDADGKITVVDENGKPVDSPPNLVLYNGKYYAVYPGDDLPIKPDGTVDDPTKLAKYEISDFTGSTEGMYLHEDADGNITVVDENGKPVDSPPAVVIYQGKKYLAYPGDNPINPDGTLKDPSKLIAAEDYKASTEGMYLHEDGDGNVTVVDENGKPVDSPPTVIEYQGKKYLAYPGESPINPDGTLNDPSKLVAAEYYKTSTDGMFLYEDGDGNITVVDENGQPVDSPPVIITFQGKKYAVYPGDNPVSADGTIKDPSKLIELSDYESPTKDIFLHEGAGGKLTVVDANGDPVASPPGVIEYQGKYYVTASGENPFGADGKLNDPSKLIAVDNYKTEIKDMYLHEGKDGKLTVVNGDGNAINSPPNVFQYQGKYYAAYPGDEPIGPDGTLKDPSKLIEIKNYKPSWWGKQAAS